MLGMAQVEVPGHQLASVVLGKDRPPASDDLQNCVRSRRSRLRLHLVLKLLFVLDLHRGPGRTAGDPMMKRHR